jgi:DICT domain-containing protein
VTCVAIHKEENEAQVEGPQVKYLNKRTKNPTSGLVGEKTRIDRTDPGFFSTVCAIVHISQPQVGLKSKKADRYKYLTILSLN